LWLNNLTVDRQAKVCQLMATEKSAKSHACFSSNSVHYWRHLSVDTDGWLGEGAELMAKGSITWEFRYWPSKPDVEENNKRVTITRIKTQMTSGAAWETRAIHEVKIIFGKLREKCRLHCPSAREMSCDCECDCDCDCDCDCNHDCNYDCNYDSIILWIWGKGGLQAEHPKRYHPSPSQMNIEELTRNSLSRWSDYLIAWLQKMIFILVCEWNTIY
jgi:hypothetical protein